MAGTVQSDVLIIGGGLAGLVTALECLRAGQRVTLVDRDTPERLGGLSLWAFGGMALVDTPLQRRMKLKDSPEIALRDWIRFGELGEQDVLPRQWARYYVEHSRAEVYDWLIACGLKFMPAVNWVEQRQHPAALPRRLGHLAPHDLAHDRAGARGRFGRAPHVAQPAPCDGAGERKRRRERRACDR